MDIKIDQATVDQIHKLLSDLAKFMALYEQSDDKLKVQQFHNEEAIKKHQNTIQSEIDKIKSIIDELSELMTATGVARWRVAAENAMSQGEEHAKLLADLVAQFKILSDRSISRIERVSMEAEKRIAKVVSTLAIEQDDVVEQFRQRAEESYESIDKVSSEAQKNITKTTKRIRWERFGIAIGAAVVASLMTGLYLNAELPWESYSRALKERQIGRSVMQSWPKLTDQEQQQIAKMIRLDLKKNSAVG